MVADRLAERGEAVTPHPWCRWVWRAWHTLNDDRHWRSGGMGPASPCNIPWSVVRAYAADHGCDMDVLFRLLRAMDGVYRDWWDAQQREAADRAAEDQRQHDDE